MISTYKIAHSLLVRNSSIGLGSVLEPGLISNWELGHNHLMQFLFVAINSWKFLLGCKCKRFSGLSYWNIAGAKRN